MKTIYLLRHAKSLRDDPAESDFDRPLSERGREIGPILLSYLKRHRIHPALVLCSSARRAVETLNLITPALGKTPTLIEDDLYMAGPSKLLKRLRHIDAALPSVMVIGHNPGIERLAEMLTGGGDKTLLERIIDKFPTGALATLEAEDDLGWHHLGHARLRLVGFVTPKEMAEG